MVRFKESNFLKFFVEHRTSANIIMLLMIIIGLLSIGKLNKQFFPDFDVEVVAFQYGYDMQKGRTDIETAVSRINFPEKSKKPKIIVGEFFDTVTRIVLSGEV